MIRTIQPQVIDAMNRRNGVVYIKACNRRENESDQTVRFDVELYTLETASKVETIEVTNTNENGEQYISFEQATVNRHYFKLINRREAVYRMSTFYTMIGNITPAQYDNVLIAQIEYVNSRPLTGNEIQKDIYFWDLTAADLENVTPEEIADLLTPTIVE